MDLAEVVLSQQSVGGESEDDLYPPLSASQRLNAPLDTMVAHAAVDNKGLPGRPHGKVWSLTLQTEFGTVGSKFISRLVEALLYKFQFSLVLPFSLLFLLQHCAQPSAGPHFRSPARSCHILE